MQNADMSLADCKYANARTVKEACTYACTAVRNVHIPNMSESDGNVLIREIKED